MLWDKGNLAGSERKKSAVCLGGTNKYVKALCSHPAEVSAIMELVRREAQWRQGASPPDMGRPRVSALAGEEGTRSSFRPGSIAAAALPSESRPTERSARGGRTRSPAPDLRSAEADFRQNWCADEVGRARDDREGPSPPTSARQQQIRPPNLGARKEDRAEMAVETLRLTSGHPNRRGPTWQEPRGGRGRSDCGLLCRREADFEAGVAR